MYADAKRPGEGASSVRTPADKGGQNWQNLANVFYGWPLRFTEGYRLGYELGYGLGYKLGLICRCRIRGV